MAAFMAKNGCCSILNITLPAWSAKNMLVTYMGKDIILPGGCPMNKKGSLFWQNKFEQEFNECM